MTRPSILIARAVPPGVLTRLREHFEVRDNQAGLPLSPAELSAQLQDCVGLLATGSDRVDAALLAANPQLKVVANMAVGYNNLDIAACTAAGVVCTNTPDVLTETTADMGFALLMATARRVAEAERFLRAGRWQHWSYDMFTGPDIHGSSLGLVGFGRIGQAVARRGALGFGMRVLYHQRNALSPQAASELGFAATFVTKQALFEQADHIVLVLPYSAQTHHIAGATEIAAMKPTATLTNIGRGGLVDEDALAAALQAGRIAGAGLDVFEGEPSINPAILACQNVVLTPHIGSASTATRLAMARLAADNLIGGLVGGGVLTRVG